MTFKEGDGTAEQVIGWDHAQASLSVVPQDACTVVKVSGVIDIATAPALREGLYRTCEHCTGRLVVDLSGVSFCDACGLAVLIGTQRRATLRDIPLRLAAPSPPVARLLQLTGLDRILPIQPSPDTATPDEKTPDAAVRHARDERLNG
ncbi:STAS domain-containing protein [Actinomadura alba]|uniref:Anti-sigma factor antagonist n=1 Tax=Actinomadura alba TaxID=406431 RepID=A0ABR7LNN8_9ACTN|nr:STAS domain-containing protein [Actinomadura alba]MBC6466457.1 STAS domain-containing protein [Actinomadura alba]